MMPITRRELEILLDSPNQRDYVVSAYADLTVQDGFNRHVDLHLRNQTRAAEEALAEAGARKSLEANIEAIRAAVQEHRSSGARGLAVFSSVARGLHQVISLDFPVEDRLIINDEPFLLPLLERWYGQPTYLVLVVDSHQAHLFEAYAGIPQPVREVERDIDEDTQRDKPRFTYKKRFSGAHHERLHDMTEDKFLQEVAEQVGGHFRTGRFAGLILLGQPHVTGAIRRLLDKDTGAAVVEEAAQTMTGKPDDVADDVARVLARWHAERDRQVLDELEERWKQAHLVANGPTEVLDALQQGRATQVIVGSRRDLAGARCKDCHYRFGAPVATCPYCQGECQSRNAVQEILQMALRHRVAVHLFRPNLDRDPLGRAGGVTALLRAEANWAPGTVAAAGPERTLRTEE